MGYGLDCEEWESDEECNEHEDELRFDSNQRVRGQMQARYRKAKDAETGTTIECPFCGKLILKKTYNRVFCSNAKTHGKNNCKDKFWNFADENRCFRTQLMIS